MDPRGKIAVQTEHEHQIQQMMTLPSSPSSIHPCSEMGKRWECCSMIGDALLLLKVSVPERHWKSNEGLL